MSTTPFWLDRALPEIATSRVLDAVDAVVVGGGVTGCSCALTLARGGLRVRLFEAREVGAGASGRNGGFALRGLKASYDDARFTLGPEVAACAWELTERALDEFETLAGSAFRRTGSIRLAGDAAELEGLEREYQALVEDGLEAQWLDVLPAPLGRLFAGGLAHPRDGSISPALWVRRLAADAVAAGVEIVQHAPLDRREVDALDTAAVVLAVDGMTDTLVPELAPWVRPVRGQVLATAPFPEVRYPLPHYARHGYDYWQQTPDGRLIIGGRRDVDREAEYTAAEETSTVIQEQLTALAGELMGRAPSVTHRWAGIWGETADGLPFAGRVPGSTTLWVAGGYSGHGNVLGFVCGDLVGRAILGEAVPALRLFDPARVVPVAG